MEYEIVRLVFEDETPRSIFEVGCSPGGLLNDYYQSHPVEVGGLDLNPEDLAAAQVLFPGYKNNFYVRDAMDTPWPITDNRYDIAFSIGTMILLPNPTPVIKEMLRISRKVILAEPHGDPSTEVLSLNAPLGYGLRITHDYQKILKSLDITKYTIKSTNLGKHIIKINK